MCCYNFGKVFTNRTIFAIPMRSDRLEKAKNTTPEKCELTLTTVKIILLTF